jgi:hypothetical protein
MSTPVTLKNTGDKALGARYQDSMACLIRIATVRLSYAYGEGLQNRREALFFLHLPRVQADRRGALF